MLHSPESCEFIDNHKINKNERKIGNKVNIENESQIIALRDFTSLFDLIVKNAENDNARPKNINND